MTIYQPVTAETLTALLRDIVASKREQKGSYFDAECEHSEADGILLMLLRASGHNEAAALYEEWREIVGFWYA